MKQANHKKTNSIWFQSYEILRIIIFIKIKWKGGCQKWEGENEELVLNVYGVSVLQDEKNSVDGWWWEYHNNEKYLMLLNCTLKMLTMVNSVLYTFMSVTQSCLTLCDPTDCSPPGSSVYGIFQARLLDWVAISSSRGSSQSRDQTSVSCVSCIGRQIRYHCATWEDLCLFNHNQKKIKVDHMKGLNKC